jgi:hypothetical protein
LEASQYPFSDALTLELRQRRQDMELQLPGWRRAIDALAHRDERHADVLQQRTLDALLRTLARIATADASFCAPQSGACLDAPNICGYHHNRVKMSSL